MRTKFTPGPWKTNETIVYVEGEDEDFAICHTQAKDTNCLNIDKALANAQLIAAAPELLEAVNELMADAEDTGEFSYSAMSKARAAIAKATGKSK